MSTAPLDPMSPTNALVGLRTAVTPTQRRRLDEAREFSRVLKDVGSGDGMTVEARARDAAEQLVATSLIAPVLKGMRESNQAASPFAPNAAERSFRQLMDASIAQRLVKAGHWDLVDRVAQKMLKRQQPRDAAPAPMVKE